MHSRQWVVCVLVALLGAAGLGAGIGAGAGTDTAGGVGSGSRIAGTAAELPATTPQLDPDRRVVEIHVRPDGSAVWRFEERKFFHDADDRETFAAVRERVDGNLSYAGAFAQDLREPVRSAEAETGREMAVQNVTVEASTGRIPTEHGKVVYTFVWDGFAAVEGDHVLAGDPLGGLFIGPNTTLMVTWADGLAFQDASPGPDERREDALVWTGRMQFSATGPSLVFERNGGAGGSLLPAPVSSPAMMVGVALVALALVTGIVRRRRRRPRAASDASASDAAVGEGATGEAAPDAEGNDDDAASAAPPEELLSDEERVLALLEERGGRMKQQDLVGEMEWSETKTSEVVKRLEDAEQVEVYRIGRENVLALPGEMDV